MLLCLGVIHLLWNLELNLLLYLDVIRLQRMKGSNLVLNHKKMSDRLGQPLPGGIRLLHNLELNLVLSRLLMLSLDGIQLPYMLDWNLVLSLLLRYMEPFERLILARNFEVAHNLAVPVSSCKQRLHQVEAYKSLR